MAELRCALPLLMFLATSVAYAGDLATLPTTDAGFREKIETFIRPGGNTEDALRLLEAHQFECRVFDHHKNPLFHCSRMDEPRLYQVMIESKDAAVRTVTPSVGRIRH